MGEYGWYEMEIAQSFGIDIGRLCTQESVAQRLAFTDLSNPIRVLRIEEIGLSVKKQVADGNPNRLIMADDRTREPAQ